MNRFIQFVLVRTVAWTGLVIIALAISAFFFDELFYWLPLMLALYATILFVDIGLFCLRRKR
jgi:hypothetical protein